jgi:uncharacterized membrane protein
MSKYYRPMHSAEKNYAKTKVYFIVSFLGFLALWFVSTKLIPDGRERNTTIQFLGRFHPLLLHIPIALLILVPVLEILGSKFKRSHLTQTTGFILGIATVATCITSIDGWMLAWSGGYSGTTVARHLSAGTLLTGLCICAYFLRKLNTRLLYKIVITLCILDLVWTSHLGGSLSHGDNFLTEYMPDTIRSLVGLPALESLKKPSQTTATQKTYYSEKIVPLFEAKCVSCHGAQKVKGKLRLDSYAAIMKGGEDGTIITPWVVSKSELYRRITLPPEDDEAMPGGGKPSLKAEEIKIIERWISAGASEKQPLE